MTDSSNTLKDEVNKIDFSIFQDFVDNSVNVKTENCNFKGICRSIDGYLNTVLEDVEITENGMKEFLKTCFINGGLVKYINK